MLPPPADARPAAPLRAGAVGVRASHGEAEFLIINCEAPKNDDNVMATLAQRDAELQQERLELRRVSTALEEANIRVQQLESQLEMRMSEGAKDAGFEGETEESVLQKVKAQLNDMENVLHADVTERDSPFARLHIRRMEARVAAMQEYLLNVAAASDDFAAQAERLSACTDALARPLLALTNDNIDDDEYNCIEPASLRGEPLSVSRHFGRLGTVLKDIQGAMSLLSHAFRHTMSQELRRLVEQHCAPCKERARTLATQLARFEAAQAKFLSTKRPTDSSGSSSHQHHHRQGSGSQQQQEAQHFASQSDRDQYAVMHSAKADYEELRYEHMRQLNETLSLQRLALNEALSGAFLAIRGSIKMCDTSLATAEPAMLAVQEHSSRVRKALQVEMKQLDAARKQQLQEEASSAPLQKKSSWRPPAVDQQHPVTDATEHAGWFLKQSSGVRKDWKRRYFSLRDGALYYYRPLDSRKDRKDTHSKKGDLTAVPQPQHVVNVLTATPRLARDSELRNVVELISPNKRVYTLQAESQQDLILWITVINNAIAAALNNQSVQRPNSASNEERDQSLNNKKRLMAMNPVCADCCKPEPTWMSINLGIFVCLECSGIHRSMGVHITKVRSAQLDGVDDSLVPMFEHLGNTRVNEVLESALPPNTKPREDASRAQKETYAQEKYVARTYLDDNRWLAGVDPSQSMHLGRLLIHAAAANDLPTMLAAVLRGAQVGFSDNSNGHWTALHIAVAHGHMAAVVFLLQNGADVISATQPVTASSNQTALDIAQDYQQHEVAAYLRRRGALTADELHDKQLQR
ncbi:MAG: hypothetical protein MHM6MM_006526 [Cercozoa sp. M6MM]